MARDRPPSDSEEIEALLREVAAAPAVKPSAELFPLSAGDVVGDKYQIDARIGVGGMGVVYRATDLELGRAVALKLHRRRPDPDRLDRLMREASVMARLSHPNVVTVFEVGHHRDARLGEARLFVAMEYVEGGSVVAWAHDQTRTWQEVLDVFLQAGEGLAAAHAAGVVHRDFKPDNVLIDERGRVRVADFGLARLGPDRGTQDSTAAGPPGPDTHTQDGAVLGTPAYMAPEQWDGSPGTPASDQYAFCVSLFETLYGANPLAAVRAVDPSPDAEPVWAPASGSRVPTRIFRALERGLSREPTARFESMDALLAALRHDPWRARVRLLAVLAVVASTGTLAWSLGRSPARTCDAQAEIDDIWNSDARARVLETILEGDAAYADVSATGLTTLLDVYARSWAEEDDAACEANTEDAPQRRACLRGLRRRFAALVDALPNVDAKGRRRAVVAAAGLPSPTECAAPSPIAHDTLDEDTRTALEGRLDALQAAVALAQNDPARAQLEALRPDVEASEQPDLVARLELYAARLAAEHDDTRLAVTVFDRALAAALRSDDDRLLLEVATALSKQLSLAERPSEAERALLIAEAAAAADDQTPVRLQLALNTAQAAVHEGRERYQQAAEVARAGVELAVRELGENHPLTAHALDTLGPPLRGLGKLEEALEANARAIAITTSTQGARHPAMADLLEGRGVLLASAGRSEQAQEPLEEALALYREYAGPVAPATVKVAVNLSSVLLTMAADRGTRAGEIDRAEQLLQPLADQLEAEGRLDQPGNELLWDNLGAIALKRGRPEEAIVMVGRALSSLEAIYGPESIRLGPALTKLASAQLDLERFDDARASVTRALTIATEADAPPIALARVTLLLGMVEQESGQIEPAREAFTRGRGYAKQAGVQQLVDRADGLLAELK